MFPFSFLFVLKTSMVDDDYHSVNKLRMSDFFYVRTMSLMNNWTSLSYAVESVDPNCFWLPKMYTADYLLIRI